MNPIDQKTHERLCEYLFGELDEAGRREVETELEGSPELRAERERLEATVGLVRQALPPEELSEDVQATLRVAGARGPQRARFRYLRGGGARVAAAAVVLLVGGVFVLRSTWMESALVGDIARAPAASDEAPAASGEDLYARKSSVKREADMALEQVSRGALSKERADQPVDTAMLDELRAIGYAEDEESPVAIVLGEPEPALGAKLALVDEKKEKGGGAQPQSFALTSARSGPATPGPAAAAPGAIVGRFGARSGGKKNRERAKSDVNGFFVGRGQAAPSRRARAEEQFSTVLGTDEDSRRRLSAPGYTSKAPDEQDLDGLEGWVSRDDEQAGGRRVVLEPEEIANLSFDLLAGTCIQEGETPTDMFFRNWGVNPFVPAAQDNLSTFGIDVDTASYTLARRMLNSGIIPGEDQIRTEEFVNYFKADQPAPTEGDVFAIGLELAPSLFGSDANVDMLRVTVRGKDVDAFDRQPLALTFVVDVSGSMTDGGRLELVKEGMLLLLSQLSTTDSVAVISFSKETQLVSPMMSAGTRGPIEDAIQGLTPDGGTNVESGLKFGFEIAAAHLTPHAVNRVILFSDGVGNIGETDQNRILEQVDVHRELGIYLNTFGVGMGNHNETFLEQLANRGDGLCQYIDSAREAKRALVQGFTQAMQPIARDVKIQVDFDPAQVERYRLLGYENRAIADDKFRDDAVDAGEVNAGHQVTALYELERTSSATGPLATVRVRYKPPFAVDRGALASQARAEAENAVEIERSIGTNATQSSFAGASAGYRRSVLVAQFAELLKRSRHARGDSLDALLDETVKLEAELRDADFTEFLGLVRLATPQLKILQASETDELTALLDRLSDLHFEVGQLELMAEEGETEANAPVKEALESEIERLELAVRNLIQDRHGPEFDPESIEALDKLGYGEEER